MTIPQHYFGALLVCHILQRLCCHRGRQVHATCNVGTSNTKFLELPADIAELSQFEEINDTAVQSQSRMDVKLKICCVRQWHGVWVLVAPDPKPVEQNGCTQIGLLVAPGESSDELPAECNQGAVLPYDILAAGRRCQIATKTVPPDKSKKRWLLGGSAFCIHRRKQNQTTSTNAKRL